MTWTRFSARTGSRVGVRDVLWALGWRLPGNLLVARPPAELVQAHRG
jgi:hypothetical protein